jgi:hypothetical protein
MDQMRADSVPMTRIPLARARAVINDGLEKQCIRRGPPIHRMFTASVAPARIFFDRLIVGRKHFRVTTNLAHSAASYALTTCRRL